MTWPRAEKLAVLKSGVGPWLLGVVIQDIMVVNRKKPAAVAKKTVKKSLKSSGSSDSAAGPCATRAIRDLMAKVEDAAATWRRRLSPHKDSAPAVIKVAADCAGCGSDLTALRLLGLAESCKVVMFSESDPNKIVLHEAAARCCGVSIQGAKKYSDIFDRCDADAPTCDLFTAGYPCPSWSSLGSRQGLLDKRGLVFLKGLLFIATRRPRALILEQVSSILQLRFQRFWKFTLKILKLLQYRVEFGILNTRDFAIPQSRPRLYVIAIARECLKGSFGLPKPRTSMPKLQSFLECSVRGDKGDPDHPKPETLRKYIADFGEDVLFSSECNFVLDVGSSPQFQSVRPGVCPCLTKTRLSGRGFYVPGLKRRLLAFEAGRLQGVPTSVLKAMHKAAKAEELPSSAVRAALGDAMSVNVLASVMMRALTAAGLTDKKMHDYWRLVPTSGDAAARLSDKLFEKTRGSSKK